ncbi:MAG: murein L,D-transpeptidase [Phenylobacterium sp.]|uniref:L,D-transpeptidase family protein n=1 Tax=Phenylobacterium sp. TaxID=1871053 RepID=UPI0011F70176|nr:L,D-transpeptidase family protein [Phenylobacterium sp.]TAJ73606.1 MAG: murein L,D-transpeptidase [Phenylobacterium sp.]
MPDLAARRPPPPLRPQPDPQLLRTPRANRRAGSLAMALVLLSGPAAAAPAAVTTAPAAVATAPLTGAERSALGGALGLGDAVFSLDDAALTARALSYARTEGGQRVRPSRIDSRWTIEPPTRDLAAELAAARAAGRLAPWLASFAPTAPAYRALSEARERYAMTAAVGGWPSVPNGPSLRVGDRGDVVSALRSRLAAEGYGAASSDPMLFGTELEDALREFQARHALGVDGVLGPATRGALNVSAAERLAQIDANLERWRWMPRSPPGDRLEVDTGAQEATLYKADSPALRMRVIVGSPKHPTPMFASSVDAVILNPPWNVPASIAANELLPAEARRPGLLASMGIRWVDGHLQQRPGPKNSLGVIKFDVTSRFGVYLHDTPGKGLFVQPVRAFSHGCMRLEQPRDLALALLAPQAWAPASLDEAIAAGVTRRINLQRRVPLYVVHWTVRAEADGRLSFRPDIYGWDRKLAAALPKVTIAQGQGVDRATRQARRHV